MILQALTQLYEDLAARGDISRPGWSKAKISYALCLEEDGTLLQAVPQFIEEQIGVPIKMVSNGPGREEILYR